MSDIGTNIRKQREKLGLTQEELAKRLGYKSKSTINKIEMGINDISQSKIKAFAKALDTSIAYLMDWDNDTNNSCNTNDDTFPTINKRIKELRKTLNLTQQEFADKIGIARGNVAAYEVGKNLPSDAVITLICREWNVNEAWLRTGNGEMFLPNDRKASIEKLTRELLSEESDSFKNRFVTMLSKLSVEDWEFLEKKAIELFENQQNSQTPYERMPDTPEEMERMFPDDDNNDDTSEKKNIG